MTPSAEQLFLDLAHAFNNYLKLSRQFHQQEDDLIIDVMQKELKGSRRHAALNVAENLTGLNA